MLRQTKDRFLDAIFLYAYDSSVDSKLLLHAMLDVYDKVIKGNVTIDTPENRSYVEVLRQLMQSDIDVASDADVAQLMMQINSCCKNLRKGDPERIETILNGAMTAKPETKLRRIRILKMRLQHWTMWVNMDAHMRQLYMLKEKVATTVDPEKQEVMIQDLLSKGREMVDAMSNSRHNERLDTIDCRKTPTIVDAVRKYRTKRKKGVLKFGWQALNRMLNGGVMIGEFMVTAALSHNYKSGLLMKMARWICQYNNPPPTPDGMTPTVLFISLENEIFENLMQIYCELKIMAGEEPDITIPEEELANYIVSELGKRGWLVVFERVDDTFTWNDFITMQQKYRNEGCKIWATLLDYLIPMSLDGIDEGSNDAIRRQKLSHKFATLAEREMQFIGTSMQFGPEAEVIAASGVTNVVKKFRAGMLGDCKGVKREAGIMIYHHLEKTPDGDVFFTAQWDKHRYQQPPPVSDQYFAMKFISPDEGPVSMIGAKDDLLTEDQSYTDIYAMQKQSKELLKAKSAMLHTPAPAPVKGTSEVDLFQ